MQANVEQQLAWIERTIATVATEAPALAEQLRKRWLQLAGKATHV